MQRMTWVRKRWSIAAAVVAAPDSGKGAAATLPMTSLSCDAGACSASDCGGVAVQMRISSAPVVWTQSERIRSLDGGTAKRRISPKGTIRLRMRTLRAARSTCANTRRRGARKSTIAPASASRPTIAIRPAPPITNIASARTVSPAERNATPMP
jgi:hypothetical protein